MLLALAGCAGAPFAPPELAAVRPRVTAQELAGGAWTAQAGVYRLRQTVLFEFRGARVPMSGMMRLDLGERKARLVAMNDLGVKFFDLAVDERGEELNYLLPDLAEIPRFSEAVAASVRRVFLTPRPAPGDALRLAEKRYLLERSSGGGVTRFVFGGNDPQLIETGVETEEEDWKVRYFEYRKAGETVYPRGIVLDDRLAGYRLTLWLEEVERLDE
jgi:hypothetical protein